jgi:FLVCR family feline leukemia virus subgroup C receptor-related protein
VALNFNQIGIATAFLVGGAMATTTSGLEHYFGLISVLCTILLAGTVLQFENLPPTPPSVSELDKLGDKAVPFLESVQKFFSTPGFTLPLAAFICSISITNVVGAFIDELMERGGIANQLGIDLAGAGFELAILLGGIVIGGFVDRTKEYKKVTLACLAATFGILLPLGLTNEHLGNEPILLVAALLGLGIACGPVQPINAELAVDVTYPGDETAVESVQQIGGNLVSALLVPLADMATRQDWKLFSQNDVLSSDIRGDVLLLMAISAITFVYFSGFNAPLLRTMADTESVNEEPIITNGAPVIDVSSSSREELQNVNK